MRLGQLARKLAVKQNELVDFLAQKNIHIENGGNTKIEEAHLALLIEKFAPAGVALSASEISEPEVIEEAQKPLDPQPIFDVVANENASETSTTGDQKIELIKAPKIELSGLKVLGKIELPEVKKKEVLTDSAEPDHTERKPKREFKNQNRDRRQARPVKNPIALEREREAKEAEERKREQAEREKERKTLRYMKKMNATQPVKAVRAVHEAEEEVVTPVPVKPEPKTAWGRFMRWLNT